MEIHGVACMRRRSDGWLNATQILKVAGVDKGKRTKVLEKEILNGEHEKVQGGYGKYQGTWISYKRGREFCRQYGVEDILRPLLDYDVSADGSGGGAAQQNTPTKEQAMAANRKRFYTNGPEAARSNGPAVNGTFFSNISPTTSVALAAMNKAARLNSPAPRPGTLRRPSQQDGAYPGGSQQSFVSDSSFGEKYESGYGTQSNGEPPRKRLRPDSQDGGMGPPGLPLDASMRSATPTEPNESFTYDASTPMDVTNGNGEPVTHAPLPNPSTDEQQDKMSLILDLFAEAGRTDYTNHPALSQLSGEDLNLPLDASANNALHWAATLAKVSLLKLLIKKGANIYRGNAAGQSPLISAVLVNNCWEHSCFPEMLDLLGPLIEIRDIQGRTILHHIAVSSGIKGRAPSSKYYLEALLEFLVRTGTHTGAAESLAANIRINGETASSSQHSDARGAGQPSNKGPVTLLRFLSHIVNARDKAGNTALNLVARVGNRSIIQQLMEIHADPSLPNYKGVSAIDFGVHADDQSYTNGLPSSQHNTFPTTYPLPSQEPVVDGEAVAEPVKEGNRVEDLSQEVISSMTTMLTQSVSSHKDTLRLRTEQIDSLNAQIQELSALQKQDIDHVDALKERVRERAEKQARIANLRRNVAEKRRRSQAQARSQPLAPSKNEVEPNWLDESSQEILSFEQGNGYPNALQRQFISSSLPPPPTLRALVDAYMQQNSQLQRQADELKSRSTEVETMYRKVISLCTGVEEEKVEESLPSLVAAVESEKGGLGEQEVGKVRDFLRRVDHAVSRPGAAMVGVEG